MERILWSVTLHFKYVVKAIKESKDLNEVSINELQASLAAHEHHLNSKKSAIAIDDALQSQLNMMIKEEILNKIEYNQRDQISRGRGWRNNCFDQWQGYNERTNNRGEEDSNQHDKSQIQCYKCQKYGHCKKDCKSNNIQCNYCKRFGHSQYEGMTYSWRLIKMHLRLCFWKL